MNNIFKFFFIILMIVGLLICHIYIYTQNFNWFLFGGVVFAISVLGVFLFFPSRFALRGVATSLTLLGVINEVGFNYFMVSHYHLICSLPLSIGLVLWLVCLSDHAPPSECWGG